MAAPKAKARVTVVCPTCGRTAVATLPGPPKTCSGYGTSHARAVMVQRPRIFS
jgi:hypothetical protein